MNDLDDDLSVSESIVMNREATVAGISIVVIPHPKGFAVLVPGIPEPVDNFLVWVTYKDRFEEKIRVSASVVIANSGWGKYRSDVRCEYALFAIDPAKVNAIYVEPVVTSGTVAGFPVWKEPLDRGISGRG